MLYRFREAQAAELGLGTRGDKRPRMASACNSLRDCERWRGEILREISRKVSKIQDGMSIILQFVRQGSLPSLGENESRESTFLLTIHSSWYDRLRSTGSERRDQWATPGETTLGEPDCIPWWSKLSSEYGHVG